MKKYSPWTWSRLEQLSIINFLQTHGGFSLRKTGKIWEKLEEMQICPGQLCYGMQVSIQQAPRSLANTLVWELLTLLLEDKKILNFLLHNGGKTGVWHLLERSSVVQGSSWQSLKQRFRGHILNKIWRLPPVQRADGLSQKVQTFALFLSRRMRYSRKKINSSVFHLYSNLRIRSIKQQTLCSVNSDWVWILASLCVELHLGVLQTETEFSQKPANLKWLKSGYIVYLPRCAWISTPQSESRLHPHQRGELLHLPPEIKQRKRKSSNAVAKKTKRIYTWIVHIYGYDHFPRDHWPRAKRPRGAFLEPTFSHPMKKMNLRTRIMGKNIWALSVSSSWLPIRESPK